MFTHVHFFSKPAAPFGIDPPFPSVRLAGANQSNDAPSITIGMDNDQDPQASAQSQQDDTVLVVGALGIREQERLFIQNDGPGLLARHSCQVLELYRKKIGISVDRFGPHSARATAATNALDAGADIAKVQEWLGHASVGTTRVYAHRETGPEDSPVFKLCN